MLKNSVFKPSVDTQKWLKAAGIRAVKTMAQAAIAGIGAAAAMGQVDWKHYYLVVHLPKVLQFSVWLLQF